MNTIDPRRIAWAYLSKVVQGTNRRVYDSAHLHGPEETAGAVRSGEFGEHIGARAHIETARADLELITNIGGRLVTPDDDEWPAWRFVAFDGAGMPQGTDNAPPLALWTLGTGRLDEMTQRSISIVGTRAATAYGEHVTAEISGDLAVDGWTIVSGAAFGIDGAAHRAALGVGGTTLAVLACGVDRAYPSGHARLLKQIADRGAVISEYAPGTPPAKYRFLARNRIVAGCGEVVVVVEAGWRSGARNTAAWARRLGRPVLAVPGPVTSASSKGCHRMIREGEARLVTNAHDIVEEAAPAGTPEEEAANLFRDIDLLSGDSLRVYEALAASGSSSVAEISELSSVPVSKVRSALPQLELGGFIGSDDSGWFRRPGR